MDEDNTVQNAEELTNQGIVAYNANQKDQARALFRQAIAADGRYEMAWLWLCAVVENQAQKRFCLEQALAINPASVSAQQGLASLPPGTPSQSPFPEAQPRALPETPALFSPIASSPSPFVGVSSNQPLASQQTSSTAQLPMPVAQPANIQQGASKMTRAQGFVLILLLCIGIGVVAGGFFFKSAPTWEYQTVSYFTDENDRTGLNALKFSTINVDEAQLAQLGAQGWELVGTYLEMETAYPNFGKEEYVTGLQPNVRPQRAVFIFKRPIGFFQAILGPAPETETK